MLNLSARKWYSIPFGPVILALKSCQVLVHELDGDRTFADRRRAALDRVEAHVAGDEDPGDAGFEQIGLALQLPGRGRARLQVGSGQNEALGVERDRRARDA